MLVVENRDATASHPITQNSHFLLFSWRQIMVDVKKTGDVIEKRKKVKEMLGKSVRSRSVKPKELRMSSRKPLAVGDYKLFTETELN